VKTYLTVNTVLYDNDLEHMRQIVDVAKEAGVSAIIAADVAAMQYACSQGVEVHLSTQLNIANVEALKFYAQFADVVVLARELNLDQVKHIYDAIQTEQIRGKNGEILHTSHVGSNFESSPIIIGNKVVCGSRGSKIFKMSIE
jgi:putative protease